MRTTHRRSLIFRRALWLSGMALALAGMIFAFAPIQQVTAARQALVARLKSAVEPVNLSAHKQECSGIICPENFMVGNTPGQCGANVDFTPPAGNGCGPVTCVPPPNSFFPVGTTTVNCFAGGCSVAFALTTANTLISFDPSMPGTISAPVAIQGLGATENVVGIDFRPANGLLYGLGVDGTTARLLGINPLDGMTAQIGATFTVSGTAFGFDFNPTVDRLRVVSDTDINLSINPDTGAVTVQTPLNPGAPNVIGSAYTNNFPGATTTTLYAIDSAADTLQIQSPPASGTLTDVGSLGVNTTDNVGFDISQCGGTAFATLTPDTNPAGFSNLYTIDLATGAATLVGSVGVGVLIRGLAVGLASAGSTANCAFTVTVIDTEPPVITCPANLAVGTTGDSAVVNYPPPTVSDNCPGIGAPVCAPASGSSFPVGVTTVTCTVADAAGNTATCGFTITVNPVSFSIDDPLVCTGPGNLVTATFTITNTGAAPVGVAATVALPGGLLALPGSCVASVGSCLIPNASTVLYTATLAPSQTATVTYQAQVGGLVTPGTILCSNLTVSFGGGPPLTVQVCLTADCPAVGPGSIFPPSSEVSDQKAGSVLFYNFYTSSASGPHAEDTRINLTNIHPVLSVRVHLFFVEGPTCSVADSVLCLTPNQTASFRASDLDPGTNGYIVAVAIDSQGCPTNFNYLIGDEYVKLSTGHAANLGAEAFSALAGGLPLCNENSVTAQLNFDGISYNRAPRVLALDNIPSRVGGNDTLLVINRFGGNLATGAARLGPIFGVLYNDTEQGFSFTFTPSTCQFRNSLTNSFPRTTPRIETVIPADRSGWMKLWSQGDEALLGAAINFNPNAAAVAGAFNQGHNLHKLTLTTTAVLTIPIFPPSC